jgi:glycosyltransferase involved in cell wall biosynthesis
MRLLVVSQYFWPETFIVNDLVTKLAAHGHEVVVATGKPNYPDGKVFPGYSATGMQLEKLRSGVDVIRVPIWPRGKGGALNLTFNYLSFVLSGLVYIPWLLRSRPFDVILVFAPSPIVQAIPAILMKWLKRAHLAIWIQDLWPESLVATGFVRNRVLLNGVALLVRWIYAFSDTLLIQSKAFAEPVAKYAARDKLVYFPNSVDPSSTSDTQKEHLPPEVSSILSQGFNVVFAGNIGKAQAIETLVGAAALLKGEADVRIVLVGSGSMLDWAKAQKTRLKLDNLILPGRFSAELMPQLFSQASALLVSLKSSEALAHTIPSKLQAYLAAGRPIIAALRGEGARIVLESGAGVVCEPDNPAELAGCIRKLRALMPEDRVELGCSGRRYFDKNFDMNHQVLRLVEILRARNSGLKGQ